MRYRLQANAKLGKEFRKIFQSLVEESALSALQACRNAEEGIHNTRKAFKELRTLLRLLRPHIPEPSYQCLQKLFREAGRQLSARRDAQVMLRTWSQLQREHPSLASNQLQPITHRLQQHESAAASKRVTPTALLKLARQLESVRFDSAEWPLKGGFNLIEATLERFYRRCRKAWLAAFNNPQPQNFHESRKRFKDLFYSLRILNSACGNELTPTVKVLDQLTETLGDSNDLAVLWDFLQAQRQPSLRHPPHRRNRAQTPPSALAITEEEWWVVQQAFELAQEAKRQQAHELAAQVLAKKPNAFIRELRKARRQITT